jgi:hypothetical protein
MKDKIMSLLYAFLGFGSKYIYITMKSSGKSENIRILFQTNFQKKNHHENISIDHKIYCLLKIKFPANLKAILSLYSSRICLLENR